MNASKTTHHTQTDWIQANKAFATDYVKKLNQEGSAARIEILNAYVEIGNGIHQPTCISYSEKGFNEQFESALRKWKIV
jgi:hypothetical protein